jgi:hypothetical protein
MAKEWADSKNEIKIYYDPAEKELYKKNSRRSAYFHVRWPLRQGRGKYGEFPLVVVREHFRALGYTVLASEPNLPNDEGFIVVSYPRKRAQRHPAYLRMAKIFGLEFLEELNRRADAAKKLKTGNRGGGDPDLFVYRGSGRKDRFFVEVKDKDQLTPKQLVAFPFIEELCPVKVVRIIPR